MGWEEDGMSPELVRLAGGRMKVPMTGQIQSLNVSVAAGIMLFEVWRLYTSAAADEMQGVALPCCRLGRRWHFDGIAESG